MNIQKQFHKFAIFKSNLKKIAGKVLVTLNLLHFHPSKNKINKISLIEIILTKIYQLIGHSNEIHLKSM